MMDALTDLIIKINDDRFEAKIRYHLIKAAIAVINEDAGTVNHANRLAYGKTILGDAEMNIDSFVTGVGTNATIITKITTGVDYNSDLDFVVGELFDAYASAKG